METIIKEVENVDVHVVTCEMSSKYEDTINLVVEEQMLQLGEKGEEKVTDQFGLDTYRLHVILRAICKRYLKMSILAGGRMLDAGETAAVLAGATLTISRKLAKAGEPRKEVAGKKTGTYERDVYVAEILKVEFTDEPMFSDAEVKQVIRENNQLNKLTATSNVFNF